MSVSIINMGKYLLNFNILIFKICKSTGNIYIVIDEFNTPAC